MLDQNAMKGPSILAASDLSHRSDRAVARGVRLAAGLGMPLVVAHVVDDDLPEGLIETMRREAERLLERITRAEIAGSNIPCERLVVEGDVVPTLIALAADRQAQAIVAGLHRERPFVDGLIETTVERLARLADRPVVVARDPADREWRRVLVAVDASPAAAEAARAAMRLAPGAEIRGFHAVHLAFQGLTGSGTDSPEGRAALREAKAEIEAWGRREGLADLAAATTVVAGSLGEVMTRERTGWGADALALGANARGGLAPRLLGSFARAMMREPPCDLILAHAPRQR